MSKKPVRVAVTGAAGQIGYALLFRIASGEMLGRDQPVILQLLEIPDEKAQKALKGVMMELEDCAFPLLAGMQAHGDAGSAFKDTDYALLVGARPRGPGMERKDLLAANAQIFTAQGKALDKAASRNVRVLVVGNPANTNAYIAMKSAPSLPRRNFTAMLRLDHNRALSQIAAKTGKAVADIEKLVVWGNHSPTMYADYRFATIGGQAVKAMINDDVWNKDVFLPTVGKRGAAIIEARGLSSAASAANAAIFTAQGKALDAVASRNVKVLVVGNPANTNAYIAMKSAPSLPKKNFTAMLRLDHNRALSQLAAKSGKPVASIKKLVVWGNHSPTMYPDYRFATADGQGLKALINDAAWNKDTFLPTVGKRGAAIIEARGLSSAASAANAAIDHMRDWALGTNGEWVTMGIASDGSYGIPADTMYGFPVICANGEYTMIKDLEVDAFSRERMDFTLKELNEERDGVQHLLA